MHGQRKQIRGHMIHQLELQKAQRIQRIEDAASAIASVGSAGSAAVGVGSAGLELAEVQVHTTGQPKSPTGSKSPKPGAKSPIVDLYVQRKQSSGDVSSQPLVAFPSSSVSASTSSQESSGENQNDKNGNNANNANLNRTPPRTAGAGGMQDRRGSSSSNVKANAKAGVKGLDPMQLASANLSATKLSATQLNASRNKELLPFASPNLSRVNSDMSGREDGTRDDSVRDDSVSVRGSSKESVATAGGAGDNSNTTAGSPGAGTILTRKGSFGSKGSSGNKSIVPVRKSSYSMEEAENLWDSPSANRVVLREMLGTRISRQRLLVLGRKYLLGKLDYFVSNYQLRSLIQIIASNNTLTLDGSGLAPGGAGKDLDFAHYSSQNWTVTTEKVLLLQGKTCLTFV
jgi:hypothetical protein